MNLGRSKVFGFGTRQTLQTKSLILHDFALLLPMYYQRSSLSGLDKAKDPAFVFKSCWISCRSFTELSRLCTSTPRAEASSGAQQWAEKRDTWSFDLLLNARFYIFQHLFIQILNGNTKDVSPQNGISIHRNLPAAFWAGSPSSTFRRKASTSSTNLVTCTVPHHITSRTQHMYDFICKIEYYRWIDMVRNGDRSILCPFGATKLAKFC